MIRQISAFAAYCIDAPGADEPRREHQRAHLAYVEEVMERLLIAGPLKDEAGKTVGSLIVFAVETEVEARQLLGNDPYHRAGVWQDVRIARFLPVAGTLVGGRNW
jgi:hypothetical protein